MLQQHEVRKSAEALSVAAAAACLVMPMAVVSTGCKKNPLPEPQATHVEKQETTAAWQGAAMPARHLYAGLPVVSNRTTLVITNIGFISGYDKERLSPSYVCYQLFPIGPVGSRVDIEDRPGSFTDGDLYGLRMPNNPLSHTGFDHGHLAPNYAIASRYGREAQKETFFMWNIVPQVPDHNRRTWKYLEALEADRIANGAVLWVVDGPVFDAHREIAVKRNGISTGIEVPDDLYKIWLREENGSISVQAFIIPQSAKPTDNFSQFLKTVREVEQATGINFFEELPDEVEGRIEQQRPDRVW